MVTFPGTTLAEASRMILRRELSRTAKRFPKGGESQDPAMRMSLMPSEQATPTTPLLPREAANTNRGRLHGVGIEAAEVYMVYQIIR